MMSKPTTCGYGYTDPSPAHTESYLWAPIIAELATLLPGSSSRRVFDLGCGNGAFARQLKTLGYEVTGVDPSEQGIAVARKADEALPLFLGSAYDPLAVTYGTFPVLVSLEVVEHVYDPRTYARTVKDLLEPGGRAIISTPYHSYLKNLALALSGKMDAHFTALWDHGHIKFWSVRTLTELFTEQGLKVEKVIRAGRIPMLGKSMILIFRKL